MHSDLTYRPINELDINDIFHLGLSHFGSSNQYSWDWSAAKIRHYLDEEFGTGLVCTRGNLLAGFALAQNKYSEQRPDVAWLTYIMINPDFKQRGVGKELFNRISAKLKESGVREIITDVYEDNRKSLEFFDKQGFAIRERWFILAKPI